MRGTGRLVALLALVAIAASACGDGGIDVAGDDATIDVTVTPLEDAPVARRADAAIAWTGTEFVVTGGVLGDEKFGDDGEPETADDGPVEDMASEGQGLGGALPVDVYDPALDAWRTASPSPLPARARHVAVWTGDEVLVWGGTARRNGVGDLLDAAAWDPATDTWRELPPSPEGSDRSGAEALVLGRYVVIGGGGGPQMENDGQLLAFDLVDEVWSILPGGGVVLDLHDAGDGTAYVLRQQTSDADPGMAPDQAARYVVGRLRVDELEGLVDEPVATPLLDPVAAEDAPNEAFPFAAGLTGVGSDVAVVFEPANDLATVFVPAVGTDWADTPTRVAGLRASAMLRGLQTWPALPVDGVAVQFGVGGREPLVAFDPATGTARAVELTGDRSCSNGLSWALGDGRLLLVSGDCGGAVVTATTRG